MARPTCPSTRLARGQVAQVWTPPAETACVLPWLGRHSVVPSRGRGVGPPLHEATHLLRQQQRTGVIAKAAHLIGPCSAPSWDASMPKILLCHHAPPISTRQAHGRTRVAASVRVSAAPVSSMRPRASSGSYTSRRRSFLVRMRHGTGVHGPMRGRRRAPRSSRRALERRRAAPQSTPQTCKRTAAEDSVVRPLLYCIEYSVRRHRFTAPQRVCLSKSVNTQQSGSVIVIPHDDTSK